MGKCPFDEFIAKRNAHVEAHLAIDPNDCIQNVCKPYDFAAVVMTVTIECFFFTFWTKSLTDSFT